MGQSPLCFDHLQADIPWLYRVEMSTHVRILCSSNNEEKKLV